MKPINPLLAVFESYVLAAIGELDAQRRENTEAIVRRMMGGAGDWVSTVRKALGLSESVDAELRTMWATNKAQLSADEFAKMVAEENFPKS